MKTLEAWECLRCGKIWPRRRTIKPKKCANKAHCASYFWDTPRVRRAKTQPADVSRSPSAGNRREATEGQSQ